MRRRDRDPLGDIAPVLVHRRVPEDKRVGKIPACSDEDTKNKNEDLIFGFFVPRIHAPLFFSVGRPQPGLITVTSGKGMENRVAGWVPDRLYSSSIPQAGDRTRWRTIAV